MPDISINPPKRNANPHFIHYVNKKCALEMTPFNKLIGPD